MPALLFPFTFLGVDMIDNTYGTMIDEFLIILPYTIYPGLAAAFTLVALTQYDTKLEKLRDVYVSTAFYYVLAGLTSFVQLTSNGQLKEFLKS